MPEDMEFGEDEEFDEFEDGDEEFDEFGEEDEPGEEDGLAFEGMEELAETAMDDPDDEDEFLGILGGLAAKALPAWASTIVPQVIKFGRGLSRRGARRVVRRLPGIVGTASRVLARNPRAVRRNPASVGRVLHRCARVYGRRGRRRRIR